MFNRTTGFFGVHPPQVAGAGRRSRLVGGPSVKWFFMEGLLANDGVESTSNLRRIYVESMSNPNLRRIYVESKPGKTLGACF